MKTNKKTRLTFSHNRLDISLPVSWNELSQDELLNVFNILSKEDITEDDAVIMAFVALCNIRVMKIKENNIIIKKGWWIFGRKHIMNTVDFILAKSKLDFIIEEPKFPVNLSSIRGYEAINNMLQGVSFVTYLTLDNYYNTYIRTKEAKYLLSMFEYLYNAPKTKSLYKSELFGIFFWWYSLKLFYASKFNYLFSPAPSGENEYHNPESSVNAMIRSLTGGDITKEKEIFEFDTYRALTELNEKAREVQEYNKKIKRK